MDELLERTFANQWSVFALVTALLLLLAEVGYRLGRRIHQAHEEGRRAQVGAVQGAVLGLLGLLLGFTFAMAVQRFETRRALVVEEANSIGTTYLRAAFLAQPHRREIEAALRRYVDVRLEFATAGRDRPRVLSSLQAAANLHQELWRHALAASTDTPAPLLAAFITSLNQTIDLVTSRAAALTNHVPGAVWLLVLVVAASGCGASGYGGGAHGRRLVLVQFMLPVLIAIVVTILVDLDHPRRGLIGTSQHALVLLKESLGGTASAAPGG